MNPGKDNCEYMSDLCMRIGKCTELEAPSACTITRNGGQGDEDGPRSQVGSKKIYPISVGCHATCHVPGLAPIFLFLFTITSPSFPSVCALEGLLFYDVISLTHICVPLLRPMTIILGLTHPSSLIYDMTSSSLTRCVLSRL